MSTNSAILSRWPYLHLTLTQGSLAVASQPRWSRLSSFRDPLNLDPLPLLRPLSDSAVLSGFVSQVSLSMSSQKMMPLLVLLTTCTAEEVVHIQLCCPLPRRCAVPHFLGNVLLDSWHGLTQGSFWNVLRRTSRRDVSGIFAKLSYQVIKGFLIRDVWHLNLLQEHC